MKQQKYRFIDGAEIFDYIFAIAAILKSESRAARCLHMIDFPRFRGLRRHWLP